MSALSSNTNTNDNYSPVAEAESILRDAVSEGASVADAALAPA